MEIKERKKEGFMIVELKGSLDTPAAKQFDARLKDIFAFESTIIVNCRNLDYISSMGIRSIMTAARIVHGRFALCEVLDRVKDVFELSGLLTFLPVYEKENDAIEALKKLH
jgi:anti-sigma B factor antagonist